MKTLLRFSVCFAVAIGTWALPANADMYGSTGGSPFNWSGWYLGGNGGWGWRSENKSPNQS
jgi:hypothetical protein